jgi:methylisocitrate lyase
MTWLDEKPSDSARPGDRLAELWRQPGIVKIPGAHNALAALMAKKAGFQALYLSGAALTASLGLPDLGILGLGELCFFTRAISRAAALPLVVDAGAAAIQIEDQLLPKKCGHLNDKRLAAPEEMAAKINAAVRARRALRIIARTDAAGVEGFDSALERARLYIEAGADAIFPEAP